MADTLRDAGDGGSQPDDINDAIDELLDTDLMDNYAEEFAHVLDAIKTEVVQEVSGGTGVDVTGSRTNPTIAVDQDDVEGVPSGLISMWSGSTSDIPDGWTLCNGENENGVEVPNLTNRFVVGAGGEYTVDETGGEKEVELSESEIPSHRHGGGDLRANPHRHESGRLETASNGEHTHSMKVPYAGATGTDGMEANNGEFYNFFDESMTPAGSHTHNITGVTGTSNPSVEGQTGSTGNGDTHENRPPYYALAYIMKL